MDLIVILVIALLFIVSLGYVHGCDALKGSHT